jgi:hypothetical protein
MGVNMNINKKIVELNDIIKQQEKFIEQSSFTLMLLKVYRGNIESFPLLIGEDVRKEYNFKECEDNREWVWGFLDEISYDMIHKVMKFELKPNGIFSSLHFSKKTTNIKEIIKYFNQFENSWNI